MRDSFSRLGFGCARIGSFNNPMSDRESDRLLEHALDLGITLFDTADIYGQGDSEKAVGRLLRGRRDAAFVVTKVGQRFSAKARVLRPFKRVLKPLIARSAGARASVSARRTATMATDFSPSYVGAAIDGSLRRLGVETVDGVLLHSPAATDLHARLFEALEHAKARGKLRHFGVACDDAQTVHAALAWSGVGLIELAPPVFEEVRTEIEEAVAQRGLLVLLREVIRYRDGLAPLDAVATAARRPCIAAVIAGTTSRSHLDELAGAAMDADVACGTRLRRAG